MTGGTPRVPPSRAASGAHCPSCERFIGNVPECPFCGADSRHAAGLRTLRAGSLVLACAGLAALLLVARSRNLPAVTPGDVTASMQFARVRLEGVLERSPYVSLSKSRGSYVSFPVGEGGGSILVTASGPVADALRTNGLPGKGDRVTVSGEIFASADGRHRLRLLRATDLAVLR